MIIDKEFVHPWQRPSLRDWRDWHWQFRNRITRPECVVNSREALKMSKKVAAVYPLAITPYYFSLIDQNNPDDPIRAQCYPDSRESLCTAGMEDPLEEDSNMPVPGLIHRYPDRCLAMVTEICATYCRHCNRKRYWLHSPKTSLKHRLAKMVGYISASPAIREVIISGGDPLVFNDDILEDLLSTLRAIPQLEVLRIGSRTPVVMPMRITKNLCRILKRHRPLWFNTQFNHPQEITPDSIRACNMLQEAGIPVSNQSVLLAGINDATETMRELLYGLQKISVRPYYLFHCDPVKGCEHFRTNVKTGMAMMEEMWRHCSGLSVPQYVVDVPGSTGKIPLNAMSRIIKKELQKHKHFFDKFS